MRGEGSLQERSRSVLPNDRVWVTTLFSKPALVTSIFIIFSTSTPAERGGHRLQFSYFFDTDTTSRVACLLGSDHPCGIFHHPDDPKPALWRRLGDPPRGHYLENTIFCRFSSLTCEGHSQACLGFPGLGVTRSPLPLLGPRPKHRHPARVERRADPGPSKTLQAEI